MHYTKLTLAWCLLSHHMLDDKPRMRCPFRHKFARSFLVLGLGQATSISLSGSVRVEGTNFRFALALWSIHPHVTKPDGKEQNRFDWCEWIAKMRSTRANGRLVFVDCMRGQQGGAIIRRSQ